MLPLVISRELQEAQKMCITFKTVRDTCSVSTFVFPGRRLSGFWSFGLDVSRLETPRVYPLYLLWWCRKWKCTGTAASEYSGKQEATTRKGLCGNLFYSSCHQFKGLSHPIHVTTERYPSYQQYYYHGPYYKGGWRNWPREPVTCFYHRRSPI